MIVRVADGAPERYVEEDLISESYGFGSDFDGLGNSLPKGLKDVSMYPNIIEKLLKKNFSEKDIKKICSENLFRVWNANLQNHQT